MMKTPRSESPATDFCVALLDELLRLGLHDIVLSPGSRSQALALAAAEYERRGLVRLRVRIDERVAGFVALGLAVETALPVVIVTTSGTAVANLHPAVLEAHHSGVPLIVVSADRPLSLRGIGSNQTADQVGIFGAAIDQAWEVPAPTGDAGEADAAAQLARDVWAAATAGHVGRPAPVHVNLALADPLSGAVTLPEPDADGHTPQPVFAAANPLELAWEPGTVVVAGAGAGEIAESTARALGAPLFAEVSSGAHFGPNLVVAYRELIGAANFGDRVERVVVFGHPTLSREVPALIQRDGVRTVVVRTPGADDFNPGHRVTAFADAITVTGPADDSARSWIGRWVTTSRQLLEVEEQAGVDLSHADFGRRQLAIVREPVDRRMLVEAVWRSTWPHDRLVLAASRLIREADRFVPGKKIRVHSNRGLAGIDGTISTAIGIALASQVAGNAGVTRALVGDLAALHDAGGMLFGAGEPRPRIQLIVGNDRGGTIFDTLEVADAGPADALDRVMLTEQSVDFGALASAYGWEYRLVVNRGDLDSALTESAGPTLIEVQLAR
ncbi:MAG: 2-succinyl-5-enolpyruvyl-6-hydroxy-3-cyclohexene-carboxylate synthase [Actinomycetota bacterium]|nr:2-succinyl-5-enolpyruvyl-6-hydroxy-3-cyclohexene-carboxylate synthase [Actinomycetota bacterium]